MSFGLYRKHRDDFSPFSITDKVPPIEYLCQDCRVPGLRLWVVLEAAGTQGGSPATARLYSGLVLKAGVHTGLQLRR